jgi:hypothetical protein
MHAGRVRRESVCAEEERRRDICPAKKCSDERTNTGSVEAALPLDCDRNDDNAHHESDTYAYRINTHVYRLGWTELTKRGSPLS